ncbi:RluA family pseudouridine synthase [Ruminococcaceae bacterium OttesenSCG-928-A16]|nr:RluA family pseudouridine synthase [Ruminococcaceae bacterium OttesenSCG-928-A16]
MRQFTANKNEDGQRLSRFVLSVTQNLPNSLLYKSFRNGRIKVNGKKATPETRLTPGDVVELYINDEFFAPTQNTPAPSAASSNVVFGTVWQNSDIAILYKPAGLLCHSDITGQPTLLGAFTASIIASGEYAPAAENTFAPALCNRLDRGTEGLVIAAKNYTTLRDMNELIRQNLVQKKYLCVTVGTPPKGVHHAFLTRDKKTKTVAIAAATSPGAKAITTGVKILEKQQNLALCEIELLTGRTHQIRAHLAFLGAPILGDRKYGNPAANRQYQAKTQALCAYTLAFANPLPQTNTLQYLAGKTFAATGAALPTFWQKLHKTAAE